jgi:hypothetical protein
MSFDEARLRRNSSGVIQTMLKRLAEEEKQLERKTVGTVPVETAKPLSKAALY